MRYVVVSKIPRDDTRTSTGEGRKNLPGSTSPSQSAAVRWNANTMNVDTFTRYKHPLRTFAPYGSASVVRHAVCFYRSYIQATISYVKRWLHVKSLAKV